MLFKKIIKNISKEPDEKEKLHRQQQKLFRVKYQGRWS